MPFVKLDSQILTSTLWFDRDSRDVFITALLLAVPTQIDEPKPTLLLDSLVPDTFVVPPGWYGFAPTSGPGLAKLAGIDRAPGLAALKFLAAPDPESRSDAFDGRRMVRVDGGFILLNYDRFRERDHTSAERSRRFRLRRMEERMGEDGGAAPIVVRHAVARVPAVGDAVRSLRVCRSTKT